MTWFYRRSNDPVIQEQQRQAFIEACNRHYKRNKHHWEYWCMFTPSWARKPEWSIGAHNDPVPPYSLQHIPTQRVVADFTTNDMYDPTPDYIATTLNIAPIPHEMPERYVREMVADWIGAGMAQGDPNIRGWFEKNKRNMLLYPGIEIMIYALFEEVL
jgi:hypothetical protein